MIKNSDIELYKVINDDFLQAIKKFDDETFDAVITDPPYLINYKDWDNYEFEWHDMWLKECYRVLKKGGTLWTFMAYTDKNGKILVGNEFIKIAEKYFISDYRNNVVWARQKGRGSSKHLKSQREDIYYFYKNGEKPKWNNLKMLREVVTPYVKDGKPRGWFLNEEGKRVRWTGLGNVWVYTAPQYNSKTDKQIHPAQKPTMLLERLVLLSTNENDLILDPFAGSGTTAIAALKNKRRIVCIEKDKNYFDYITYRIEDFLNRGCKYE